MKKQFLSIAIVLMTVTCASANANQNQVLECNNGQNSLQLRVLPVNGEPSLRVLSLKGNLSIVAIDPDGNNNVGKIAHIEGQLVGKSSNDGSLSVSGLIENQDRSDVIINAQSINVNLQPNTNGSTTIAIYDEDRIFQRGFGLWLICK